MGIINACFSFYLLDTQAVGSTRALYLDYNLLSHAIDSEKWYIYILATRFRTSHPTVSRLQGDLEAKISDLQKKIQIEQKLRDGAYAMLKSLKNQNLRNDCEMKAVESQRRIDYLEGEMRKLQLRTGSVSSVSTGDSTPGSPGSARTASSLWSARQSSLNDEGMLPAPGTLPHGSKSPQPQRAGSGLRELMGTIGRPFGASPGHSGQATPKASSASGSQTSLGPEPVTKFGRQGVVDALSSFTFANDFWLFLVRLPPS